MISKENKRKLKIAQEKYKKILEACQGDYDKMLISMQTLFEQLTNPNTDRFELLNTKYYVPDIACSQSATLKTVKVNHALGNYRDCIVVPEIYLYTYAPKGIVYGLTLFNNSKKEHPIRIDLFIDKEEYDIDK